MRSEIIATTRNANSTRSLKPVAGRAQPTGADPIVYVVHAVAEERDAIRALMEREGRSCASLASVDAFLDAWDRQRPGCLIMDAQVMQTTGVEILRHLPARDGTLPMIIFTDQPDVPMVLRALKLGVFDFMQKPLAERELAESVRWAITMSTERQEARRRSREARRRIDVLTEREREILDCLLAGNSNKEVARALDLSPRTVETHRANILQKMRARSVVEIATLVAREIPGYFRGAAAAE